jgi:lipoyl(octanoyl) transferase
MIEVSFEDLGLVDYLPTWDYQESLLKRNTEIKLANREAETKEKTLNKLIFCEHPHVYTLGKSGRVENLLLDEIGLTGVHATFVRNNRGGDITYHGPGQIVGYPIFDLEYFFTDLHLYLRYLEQSIINTLKHYGIEAGRIEGLTGVWLDVGVTGKERKICAIGVRCSRWVTMHGFAFNVNADLSYFNHIVPCGIDDKAVTSMAQELGKGLDMEEVKQKLKQHIATLFSMQLSE